MPVYFYHKELNVGAKGTEGDVVLLGLTTTDLL
jgi:hypothetical protein